MNYRAAFMRLTFEAMRENNREKARKIMAQLEETIPLKVLPIRDWVFTARMMSIYNQLGDSVNFELYSKNVETACLDLIDANRADLSSDDNPYRYLLEIYDARKNYQASLDLLNRVSASYPNDAGLKSRIQFYEQRLKGSTSTDSAKLK